ncbi:MAG: hypothetical protein NC048_02920 [Bacteroides sp.]|nr:hypothetical protein [Ruminococcus flavefaciens]MCM1554428.1 hypothetical protein [Bacteroides sp.]
MNDQGYLVETMTSALVKCVMEDMQMDLTSALDAVYNSETYSKVCDEATHLIYQHPGYVYGYLKNELLLGKMA